MFWNKKNEFSKSQIQFSTSQQIPTIGMPNGLTIPQERFLLNRRYLLQIVIGLQFHMLFCVNNLSHWYNLLLFTENSYFAYCSCIDHFRHIADFNLPIFWYYCSQFKNGKKIVQIHLNGEYNNCRSYFKGRYTQILIFFNIIYCNKTVMMNSVFGSFCSTMLQNKIKT